MRQDQLAQQSSSKPVSLGLTSKDLATFFESQQRSLEKHFSDLKHALVGHSTAASDRLAIETLKRSEESEKRLLDALSR